MGSLQAIFVSPCMSLVNADQGVLAGSSVAWMFVGEPSRVPPRGSGGRSVPGRHLRGWPSPGEGRWRSGPLGPGRGTPSAHQIRPGRIPIRDASLYLDVAGNGYPLLLMHGGPGADHWTLLPFRQLADQFTLIFYDHRCNGRSQGTPVSSMTFENLTADATPRRRAAAQARLPAVGGARPLVRRARGAGVRAALPRQPVAPGARRHRRRQPPVQHNAVGLLASRGYSPEKVELVRRWFNRGVPAPPDVADPDADRQRLLLPPQPVAGYPRADPRRVALEDAARRADFRVQPSRAAGLYWAADSSLP